MSEKEYQTQELKRFYAQNDPYFESVKDFDGWIEHADILEQIEWIENGSFGAGPCFALQQVLRGLTNRCNKRARIGGIVLQIFYGAPFTKWNKLSLVSQSKMNFAVNLWLTQEHDFAAKLVA